MTISIKPVVLFGGTDTPRGPIRPPRLYNMPWILDATKATTHDLAAVMDEQQAKFPYGLAVQGDRWQGHLKMAPDCTNANKLRKGAYYSLYRRASL